MPKSQKKQATIVAIVGMFSLAVAMGIGRFAFTPLLPMMLHDGLIDLQQASNLATANYIGYWLGAIACTLQPFAWTRWRSLPAILVTDALKFGLLLTVLLTLLMCLDTPLLWLAIRLLTGVSSALVFVYTSSWCLTRLSELGAPSLGGIIYVGPGIGIVITGLLATGMLNFSWPSRAGWFIFFLLGAIVTFSIWTQVKGEATLTGTKVANDQQSPQKGIRILSIAYGLAGFGYIISATYLPVIARQALTDSIWVDLFWPIFGMAVIIGALITTRLPSSWDRRILLIACYITQGLGIQIGMWYPSVLGFAIGSLLVGMPLTAITLFAMQETRRLQPINPSPSMGLMTMIYGIGQIAGPITVAQIFRSVLEVKESFNISLYAATSAFAVGCVLYAYLIFIDDQKK
jgi:MFS family permease